MSEIFYHGTSVLFDSFSLAHALSGDGKVKFGYGVYVTQMYKTAAHYAGAGNNAGKTHYVYTLEVPEMRSDNHIWSNKPVCAEIVCRTVEQLKMTVPAEVCERGKLFRKYIGNVLLRRSGTTKQLSSKTDLEGEKAASAFFSGIGVDFYVWPYNQRNPDGEQNRAILDESKVKIIMVDEVSLDDKQQLIPDSIKQIR